MKKSLTELHNIVEIDYSYQTSTPAGYPNSLLTANTTRIRNTRINKLNIIINFRAGSEIRLRFIAMRVLPADIMNGRKVHCS